MWTKLLALSVCTPLFYKLVHLRYFYSNPALRTESWAFGFLIAFTLCFAVKSNQDRRTLFYDAFLDPSYVPPTHCALEPYRLLDWILVRRRE